MLTLERANQVFSLNLLTGQLIWKERPSSDFPNIRIANGWNRRWTGKVAGGIGIGRYFRVSIDGHMHLVHRVIWLMHYGSHPKNQIDHINGDRTDNRIANLRDASCTDNARNKSRRRDNKSGQIGVSWHKDTQKWVAQIGVNGRERHLGLFSSLDDAIFARKQAERVHGYHPNHGRS